MTLKNNICIILLSIFLQSFGAQQIVTLFSHGIADTWKQVRWYVKSYNSKGTIHHNERHTINTPFASFNYPDATTKFYRVNYNEASFGQANEMSRLYNVYQKTLEHFDNPDIILYGLSRGASNVAIFAALYDISYVKAIILESPYFTMAEVVQNMLFHRNLSWVPLSYAEMLVELIFKKYTRYGNTPANCITSIPKDIPILIVCSQEDSLVPYTSSINVYKKLRESGHDNTYIFITEHGKHAAILSGIDGEKYQWVINAFYKKYNLPFVPSDAAKGDSLLAHCQPFLE